MKKPRDTFCKEQRKKINNYISIIRTKFSNIISNVQINSNAIGDYE